MADALLKIVRHVAMVRVEAGRVHVFHDSLAADIDNLGIHQSHLQPRGDVIRTFICSVYAQVRSDGFHGDALRAMPFLGVRFFRALAIIIATCVF